MQILYHTLHKKSTSVENICNSNKKMYQKYICSMYLKLKEKNMNNIKADAHADTIEFALDNKLKLNDKRLSFNLLGVNEFLPYIQFMACFVHDKYKGHGYNRVMNILDYYNQICAKYNNITIIKNKKDIDSILINSGLGIVLTIENGVALDKKIYNIYNLYNMGIRQMTITWDLPNELGTGNKAILDEGLTMFGKRCIEVMNKIGMIIDVSHASQNTFWDIANITTKPIMASHSNVYNLCNNRRNLKDNQIKQIANLNGIIGITYYTRFLTNATTSSVNDVVNHIEYVTNLVGINHVCLGSDFDGINRKELPQNLKSIKDIYKIEECMRLRGFSEKEIKKVMGQNLSEFIQRSIQ